MNISFLFVYFLVALLAVVILFTLFAVLFYVWKKKKNRNNYRWTEQGNITDDPREVISLVIQKLNFLKDELKEAEKTTTYQKMFSEHSSSNLRFFSDFFNYNYNTEYIKERLLSAIEETCRKYNIMGCNWCKTISHDDSMTCFFYEVVKARNTCVSFVECRILKTYEEWTEFVDDLIDSLSKKILDSETTVGPPAKLAIPKGPCSLVDLTSLSNDLVITQPNGINEYTFHLGRRGTGLESYVLSHAPVGTTIECDPYDVILGVNPLQHNFRSYFAAGSTSSVYIGNNVSIGSDSGRTIAINPGLLNDTPMAGGRNVLIGNEALHGAGEECNVLATVVIGCKAVSKPVDTSFIHRSVVIGADAVVEPKDIFGSIIIGDNALSSPNANSSNSVVIGQGAGSKTNYDSFTDHVIIGSAAGVEGYGSACTYIGSYAGTFIQGNENTFIGHSAGAKSSNATYTSSFNGCIGIGAYSCNFPASSPPANYEIMLGSYCAPTGVPGRISIGPNQEALSVSAAAGTGDPTPTNVERFLTVSIGGTPYKIPLYPG